MSGTAEQIKALRQETGAGVLDCRTALDACGGDLEKAVLWLREKGLAAAGKRADRETREGVIDLYSHGEGRVGVMVEVNCETDFVARTQEFRAFAHEIALQVAASAPRWIDVADVPADVVEQERDIARKRALEEGKPEKILERIVEGRLAKFYEESCLIHQPYIRDEDKKIAELLQETVSTTGENITIRRFVRWMIGEDAA
jgi:elongation factor Ts